MRYSVKGGSPEKIVTDCLVVSIWANGKWAKILDDKTKKLISVLVSGATLAEIWERHLLYISLLVSPPNEFF